MAFARWVFRIAGLYGLAALLPQYFLVEQIGRDDPPAITHPEYFYGFIGVALAWQVAFLIISRDPVRYRPLMIVAVLEKAVFAVPVAVLYARGQASGALLGFGILDGILGVLFAVSYVRTRPRTASESGKQDAWQHRG
jgi:hypothetical protein